MPENEFEKKISTEMHELRFKPSETVWVRVEQRIRRKKKRRVFIILFLLAGISLLGYWQWNNFFGETNGDIVKTEIPVDEKNSTVNDNDPDAREVGKISNQTQQITPGEKNTHDDQKKEITGNPIKIDDNTREDLYAPQRKTDSRSILLTKQKKNVPGIDEIVSKPKQKKEAILAEDDFASVPGDDPRKLKDTVAIKHIEAENVNRDLKQTIHPTDTMESIKHDTVVRNEEIMKGITGRKADSVSKTISVDSPVVMTLPKVVNKKWKLGFDFNPGVSALNETFFSFGMNKSVDAAYQTPSSGSGGGSTASPATPSERRAGFAFQLGGFVKRQLSQRSGFSLGLRYAYYTDHLSIGPRRVNISNTLSQFLDMQGANRAFGATGDSLQFANRYHFIELPAYYTLRLNQSESHPLIIQLGLKFGRMVGSNALVYDTVAGGIYYRSDKYFNKTQFGFSGSLNWTAMNKHNFQWTLGPVIDIHFSRLLNSPFEEKNYLLFTGIRTSIKFNSGK